MKISVILTVILVILFTAWMTRAQICCAKDPQNWEKPWRVHVYVPEDVPWHNSWKTWEECRAEALALNAIVEANHGQFNGVRIYRIGCRLDGVMT